MPQARIEVRIAGLGGQGVVLAGTILGYAAILSGKRATQIQSYGAEARGTLAWSDVIISDQPITYPLTTSCDYLVAMSQQALDANMGRLKEGGVLLVDEDLVRNVPSGGFKVYKVPATRIAEELAGRTAANMVLLGFLARLIEGLRLKAFEDAIAEEAKDVELNLKAFNVGVSLADKAGLKRL
ncbi:MAG: 2-oxoacid:acceptor oxidoreductase family protein [Candidatus Nezhaarchaeales archaeon]